MEDIYLLYAKIVKFIQKYKERFFAGYQVRFKP